MEYEDPKPNLKAEDIDEKLDHSSGDEKVQDDDEENPVSVANGEMYVADTC